MKVALCSAVWGRLALTQVWWQAMHRIRNQIYDSGIAAVAFVAGSEQEHRHLCGKNYGAWVPSNNGLLGEKWNRVVRTALEWADYIFILGSDDFFSPGLIQQYVNCIQRGVKYVGCRGLYFYEPATDRTLLLQTDEWGNYPTAPGACQVKQLKHKRKRTFFGAGRLLHRSLFEGHEEFWTPEISHGLDANMARNLGLSGVDEMLKSGPDAFLVDVKTRENIWSFDHLAKTYPHALQPDSSAIQSLPEFDQLRFTLAGDQG